jgi:hypothetical protein
MENATLIAIQAALKLVDALLPTLTELVRKGELTVEQQAAVRAQYESLKAKADGQFTGTHWAA